jgi:hypothetical protein
METNDGGILSAEQVTALREKYPTPKTPAERREAARLRKQAQRTRDKEKAEIKAAISQAETIQQLWAESLKTTDAGKLAGWKAREEEVEVQLGAMRDCVEGRAFDDQFMEDVDTDTQNMVRAYGECAATPILLVGQFWRDPEMLSKLTSGDTPTAIFAKFGVLTALPDIRVHQWEQFIVSHRGSNQPMPAPVFYTQIRCSQCDAPPTSVSVATAEAYRRANNFLCQSCLAKRAAARRFTEEHHQQENVIFDSYGRVKS